MITGSTEVHNVFLRRTNDMEGRYLSLSENYLYLTKNWKWEYQFMEGWYKSCCAFCFVVLQHLMSLSKPEGKHSWVWDTPLLHYK